MERMTSRDIRAGRLSADEIAEADRRWRSMTPKERRKVNPVSLAGPAFVGAQAGLGFGVLGKEISQHLRRASSNPNRRAALAETAGVLASPFIGATLLGRHAKRLNQGLEDDDYLSPLVGKAKELGEGERTGTALGVSSDGMRGVRAAMVLDNPGRLSHSQQVRRDAQEMLGRNAEKTAASGLHMQEKLRQRPDGSYYTETREVMDSLGQARAAAAFQAMSPEERRALTEHIPAGGKVLGGLGGGLAGGGLGYLAVEAAKPKSAPVALGLLGGGALLGAVLGGKAGGKLGRDEQERRVSSGTFPVSPTSVTGANALRRLYALEEAERAENRFGKQASAEDTLSLGLHGWSSGL